MKRKFAALGLGMVSEATITGLMAWSGGLGPCGVGSALGGVWLGIHLPGFLITEVLNVTEAFGFGAVLASYALLWASLWYAAVLRPIQRNV